MEINKMFFTGWPLSSILASNTSNLSVRLPLLGHACWPRVWTLTCNKTKIR